MGNIRSKTDGSVTHLYTYGNSQWADLLTAYDGHSITYDGSGNPLSYYNGADYTFTWEQGRQLASVTKGNKTASYTYDMSGVRSSKTVNGVSYEYTTLSGKITRMTWSGNAVDIVYDDAGRPYLLRYTPSGGTTQTYYYVLNLQGDVVGLMNTSMQMVVKYSYDPWGKLTGTTATSAYVALAQANPLRYRSYCYDIETGFYYLQTRYYDPTIARFINADCYLSTDITGFISSNMFAYCENNPIMCSDPTGEIATYNTILPDNGAGSEEYKQRCQARLLCTKSTISGRLIEAGIYKGRYTFDISLDLYKNEGCFYDEMVLKYYSEYMRHDIERLSKSDEYKGYEFALMSEQHIYYEMLAHYVVYDGLRIPPLNGLVEDGSALKKVYKRVEVADLNVDESDPKVLYLMHFLKSLRS